MVTEIIAEMLSEFGSVVGNTLNSIPSDVDLSNPEFKEMCLNMMHER